MYRFVRFHKCNAKCTVKKHTKHVDFDLLLKTDIIAHWNSSFSGLTSSPKKRRSPLWGFSIFSISCCNTKISYSTYCFADVGSSLPSEAKGRRWFEAVKEGDEEGYVGGVRDVFFVFTTAELVSVSSFYLFIYFINFYCWQRRGRECGRQWRQHLTANVNR